MSACFYLQFWQLLHVCFSEIKTPAVIGNNMVLQQNHKNPIWGWDNPGESVIVKIAGNRIKRKQIRMAIGK